MSRVTKTCSCNKLIEIDVVSIKGISITSGMILKDKRRYCNKIIAYSRTIYEIPLNYPRDLPYYCLKYFVLNFKY